MTDWPAPHRATPIDSSVHLPGSKSLTNRALVLAALSDGASTITRPLRARDTERMVAALRRFGASIDDATSTWRVTPTSLRLDASVRVECGLAGTVMRFAPPVAALTSATVDFDGQPRARERPMAELLSALHDLGADVRPPGAGHLPFQVIGHGGVRGGTVALDASRSSQFVSALLLAGARFAEGVDVRHVGPPLPSTPHVAMTVAQLRLHGVGVEDDEPGRWVVRPGPVAATDVVVEPDLSTAAPFVAAALVTGGRVRVAGWPADTEQAGDRLRDVVVAAGGSVDRTGNDVVVEGGRRLQGVRLDLRDAGELAPVVAAVAALAESSSHLTGIEHLRGHETDRLRALACELNRLGARVTELSDGLRIEPGLLHSGTFHTYGDHRMAQAGAVLGLAVEAVRLDDVGVTAKTFPDFAATWERFVA